MSTVGIVDYGKGNLTSVLNAIEMLGASARIVSHAGELSDCARIILPGVGGLW